MAAFALIAGITGGAAAACLLVGRWQRRWWVGWIVALVGVVATVVLSRPPLLAVASELPWRSLGLAAGWLLLVGALRGLGPEDRPALGTHLGPAALIAGALMGDLAAALMLAALVDDPRRAARAALVASAGGMLSGIGTPAVMLVAPPTAVWPAALLAAAVAWPRGTIASGGNPRLTAALAVAALASWVSPVAGLCLALIIAEWAIRRAGDRAKRVFLTRDLMFLGAAGLASWAAWRSGAFFSAEWGIAWFVNRLPGFGEQAVVVGAALLSAVGGEAPASLMVAEILNAPLYPRVAHLPGVAAAGLAVGGLGPLLICGGLRAGWRIWLTQIAAVALWAAVMGAVLR